MVAIVVLGAAGTAAAGQAGPPEPTSIDGRSYGLSAPVRDLDPAPPGLPGRRVQARINPLAGQGDAVARATRNRGSVPPDPLASGRASGLGRATAPAPSLLFDGVGNPLACGGCTPPDTIGDVGPSNYIQMVNATKVAIFDKAGNPLAAPFDLSALFPSGPCGGPDEGDPVVLYDSIADRWLLSQFHGKAGPPHQLCFAISQTANPLGAYHLYSFPTPDFPDYFKVGVWPNGYYVSANESTYTAYAFDRAKMLTGAPATGVRFDGETNLLLPADVDGPRTPGASEGGLFYTFKDNAFHGGGGDRLELFQLTPDFAGAGSTFTRIKTLPIAPFTYTVCGYFVFDCIPQKDTASGLDSVSEWPMFRFAWRNLGGHQALVGNFTVGGGSATPGAAPRWFELRNAGAGWTLFQEGTYDPGGGLNRWMGSIAIDVAGNISLGYSASNATSFPSIRYATRSPADPPGTLGAERVMKAGAGSQTSVGNRWGDYSAMSVDPADGCSFWYTNEYYAATSVSTWSTAIGRFKIPACADTDGDGVADGADACPTGPDLNEADGCPSNDFKLGKKKLNKSKGTATIAATVPGAGKLVLTGKGLKKASKSAGGAGTFKLEVNPTGKGKKKLKRKGKLRVKPKLTYTPTGGLAARQTTKLTLKRK